MARKAISGGGGIYTEAAPRNLPTRIFRRGDGERRRGIPQPDAQRDSDAEIAAFDRLRRGLDWGYAVDPLHYTVNHYDRTRRRLYIFYELRAQEMSNRRLAEEINRENPKHREVICDSAEPKSIAEMREYGVAAIGARKGPDSVYYGIKWMQDLEEIIIDPKRCPETAREFSSYEYESDGRGGWRAAFPDRDNHAIDAVRYSREEDMRHIRVR